MTPKAKYEGLSDYDRKIAKYFLDKKKYLLFAIALDYPGFKRIPLTYLEVVRRELRSLGLKSGVKSTYTERNPGFRTFYYGPRRGRFAAQTARADATAFKIYFYDVSAKIDEESK